MVNSETVPEMIRPKNPNILVRETKSETSGYPRANPIWPILFITAKPVPTPQRNDTNKIQKSTLFSASNIVCSSPTTGALFSTKPSSSTAATLSLSFSPLPSNGSFALCPSTSFPAPNRPLKYAYTGIPTGEASITSKTATNTRDTKAPGLGMKPYTKRKSATRTATTLNNPKYLTSSASPAAATFGGSSRRKKTPVRQTAKGTTASMTRKEPGSSAKSAEQSVVNIAVLNPTKPFRIPETGPLFVRKLRMHVTKTAVFIHVVLFPPMHRKTHLRRRFTKYEEVISNSKNQTWIWKTSRSVYTCQ